MRVTSKVNYAKLRQINKVAEDCLVLTAEALKSNLVQSQTMPFDTGHLQNQATFVDTSDKASGKVAIISDTPYARRLYFHPEYNFKKDNNPNAGGEWFEPYINGNKKDYAKKVFARHLKNRI